MASDDDTFATILGITAGAIAGLAAGMLLTPESGKKTRQKLLNKSREAKDKTTKMAKQQTDQARSTLNKFADKSRAAVSEGIKAAKET